MSDTVVPSWTTTFFGMGSSWSWGRRLWNGKSRGDGTTTRQGSAVVEHDACSRVLTSCGNDKQTVTAVRLFAQGRRFKNWYADRQRTQNGTYGGGFSLSKKNFQKLYSCNTGARHFLSLQEAIPLVTTKRRMGHYSKIGWLTYSCFEQVAMEMCGIMRHTYQCS